jgi:hypothetical protein
VNWAELINQDVSWMTKGGDLVLIQDMDHNHRRNAAAMLMREALRVAYAYSFESPLPDPEHTGEVAYDIVAAAEFERLDNPEKWISDTPLFKALVDGLREDEQAGALLGVPAR